MLFYEYKITLSGSALPVGSHQALYHSAYSKIKKEAHAANAKLPHNSKFFISGLKDKYLTLAGAIGVKNTDDPTDLAKTYTSALGLEIQTIKGWEVTIQEFAGLLHKGNENRFIEDEDEILSLLGLESYSSCIRSDLMEYMVDEKMPKEVILAGAKASTCCETLVSEVERIFDGNRKSFSAHPVHYILYSDDEVGDVSTIRCLTSALYSQGRLRGRRIDSIRAKAHKNIFELEETPPSLDMDTVRYVYRSIPGGTVVVRPGNIGLPGMAISKGVTTVDELADEIRSHRHDCLTILVFSKQETDAAFRLKSELSCMRFIELRESLISPSNAVDYLLGKAKAMGLDTTESLPDVIDCSCKGYYVEELNGLFEKWLDTKLCNDIYPQYSEVSHPEQLKVYNKGDAYKRFKNLIGLDRAKTLVDKALNFNTFQKLLKDKSHKDLRMSRHMVFAGNPGTAKTTVARLFAQIMKDNGVLPVGKLIEVGRSDLVGKYVGWTAQLVAKAFKQAKGSVLFIDEAYSLCEEGGMYGDEAINTIVQNMENQRNDTIVIFAGYPDKMQQFLNKNPGLRSRIAFHVNFDDYSSEELFDILNLMANSKGMNLDDDVRQKFSQISAKAMHSKDFGNGRFVRNIFEQAIMNQATRVMSKPFDTIMDADITTLKACDFSMPEELETKPEYKTIGFAS